MEKLIENFASQIKEAINIGENIKINDKEKIINNILISGMGGSGIGGAIASILVKKESSVPIEINNNYFLPKYTNENSLLIISSYSGNTEETIEALNEGLKRKAKIVCITSGGEIEEIAKKENLDYIIVPSGMAPRAALAYSLVQILFILNNFNLINDNFKNDLMSATDLLEKERENIKNEARIIAEKIYKTFPIIYTNTDYLPLAIRLRQQLNENSKILSYASPVPEMNHNELVGWAGVDQNMSVIFLRSKNDYEKINKRIEISKEIISRYTNKIIDINSKGENIIEEILYFINIGDYISFYLNVLNKVDIDDISVINHLKNSLKN